MDLRPAPTAVLVVVVVSLAGCGAAPFGSDAKATQAETLTPVPVSTPTGSITTPVERPPGVSAGGMIDARRLREAHESAVADRSYRWTLDYDVDGPGRSDPVFEQGFTRRAVVGSNQFLVRQVDDGEPLNQSLFVNETGGYLRTVQGNVTRNETLDRPGTSEDYVASGQIIERFLSGMDPNVTRLERDGRTYYRLHDRTGLPPALERLATTVRNYSVTAYVTPGGFVRSMTVRYERFWDTGFEYVSIRFYYDDVGSATVDRPAWVDGLSLATPTPTPPALPREEARGDQTGFGNRTGPTPGGTTAPTVTPTATAPPGSQTAPTTVAANGTGE